MCEILKVVLIAIAAGLFVYCVGMIGVIAYDKFFFAQKAEKISQYRIRHSPGGYDCPRSEMPCVWV